MRYWLHLHTLALMNRLPRVLLCNYHSGGADGLGLPRSTCLRIVICFKVGFNRSPAKLVVATPLYWRPLPSLGLLSPLPFAVFFFGAVAQSLSPLSTPLHQTCRTPPLKQQRQPPVEATRHGGSSRAPADG